ncbi:MAG TPA: glycosyltransferase family 2 protein [Oligoflexia bacterium]|nr:glycosyltransferase family 2 protein [Oligoflexia bacterium]
MTKLDLLIPVYNEGDNIHGVLAALNREVQTPFRMLICYDRDDDNTLPAVKSFGPTKFSIEFVKNQGVGVHGAIMTGFQHGASESQAVIVMPADDDYNAGLIDKMFSEFERGADLVSASRFMRGGSMVGCHWVKATLVRISSFTLHFFARLPTRDATNGFRLFSRKVLNALPFESTMGFSFSLECLVKCHRLRLKVTEVPAQWIERRVGKSRFQVLKWAPAYLHWYFYAFQTTLLGKRAELPEALRTPPLTSNATPNRFQNPVV